MARIELDTWIPEEVGSDVLTKVNQLSAVEASARRETMNRQTKAVPRFLGSQVGVVPEGTVYPEATGTLDEVVLNARKFGEIYRVSEEDLADSPIDALRVFRDDFARSYSITLDNACLGTTGAENGTTVPFTSVYADVAANAAGNLVPVAGDLGYSALNDALGTLESGSYFDPTDTIIIAHPSFRGALRNLKDDNGNNVLLSLDNNVSTAFGLQIAWSAGARTSATASDSPTGNPLLIMGSKRHLILGVRSGPESLVSSEANFETDERKLKMRARRAFVVARPEAFVVLEKTA